MKKNYIIIAESVLFLAVVAGATYYFVCKKNTEEWEGKKISESYFEFNVKNENIPQDKLDQFYNKFTIAKSAIEDDADNFNAWKDLSVVKKSIGDYEGARDAWLHMNDMRPENRISFGNLGDLYTHFIVDYPRAVEQYRRAIKNDPAYIDFYRSVFQIYNEYWLEKKDLAEGILLEGLEKNPDNSDLLALLAGYYTENGKKEDAVKTYEKLIEIMPENEAAKAELEKLKAEK